MGGSAAAISSTGDSAPVTGLSDSINSTPSANVTTPLCDLEPKSSDCQIHRNHVSGFALRLSRSFVVPEKIKRSSARVAATYSNRMLSNSSRQALRCSKVVKLKPATRLLRPRSEEH